ncbi:MULTISPECIES: hypothetical protein [unclassified Diaminobutyricimonas]|uniref:hypothetical protein n=1 Tax=unclassified Diaminobutyricimonas TaxID=2643261 RepID=UPI0012F4E452|nr:MULTISPECIES: hypothetical protein [unclassified Diaminobutyricimonas]
MPIAASRQRTSDRSLIPAITVAVILIVIVLVQAAVASVPRLIDAVPVFPRQVAAYSWWTAMHSSSSVDAAIMVYQNGAGVEFLDSPQAVLLGADGTAYRRLDAAESLRIVEDQGDPAASVLSADGTFVVVGKAARGGSVDVTRLQDNNRRSILVGDGLSTVPVSIAADDRLVLILTSESSLSPPHDLNFRLHGALSLLDLKTGTVRAYAGLTDVNAAALSPDGTVIVADTAAGLVVVDAVTGDVTDRLSAAKGELDGDAWSPDSQRFALLGGTVLRIVNVTAAGSVEETVAVPGITSGSAIGWRDANTVLVHTRDDAYNNESEFSWVDVQSGAREPFASYAPDFTGASLIAPDVARDLIPVWQVDDRQADRGAPPTLLTIPLALLLGYIVWLATPRRRPLRTPVPSAAT